MDDKIDGPMAVQLVENLKKEQLKLKSDIEVKSQLCAQISKDIKSLPPSTVRWYLSATLKEAEIQLTALKAHNSDIERELSHMHLVAESVFKK